MPIMIALHGNGQNKSAVILAATLDVMIGQQNTQKIVDVKMRKKMIKNEFEKQRHELVTDYNYHRVTGKVRDKFTFHKLLLAVALLTLANIGCLQSVPNTVCRKPQSKGWLFPDTWTCSQCGYENYEGITSCGRCGGR